MITLSVISKKEEPWFVFAQQEKPIQDGIYQCDLRDIFFIVKTIYARSANKGYYQRYKTIDVSRGIITNELPAFLNSRQAALVRRITDNVKVEVRLYVPDTPPVLPADSPPNTATTNLPLSPVSQTETTQSVTVTGT